MFFIPYLPSTGSSSLWEHTLLGITSLRDGCWKKAGFSITKEDKIIVNAGNPIEEMVLELRADEK